MKHNLIRFIAIPLILASITTSTAFAFSDVSSSHNNYDAINYLQENDIVNGYLDGTFKPGKAVNRVEFLKIIIEGSGIALDEDENTPFPDVNHSLWYGPYIKKAYAEGWVKGYGDGTFKPDQTINKVEALKILGEVQEWEMQDPAPSAPFSDTFKLAWYTKYVYYAKTNGFLEEEGDNLSPNGLMTRANISEVIYRTLITDSSEEEEEEEIETEEEPEEEATPPEEEEEEEETTETLSYSVVSKTYFDKIRLDEYLPNTFYKNEIYIVSGEVSSSSYDQITIYLDSDDGNEDNYQTFQGATHNKEFSIPVHFDKSGSYHFGIIPGANGQTKVTNTQIITSLPSSTNEESDPSKVESVDIDFDDGYTKVGFSADSETLKKLTVWQGSESVIYYSRQETDEIYLDYKDFEDFSSGPVSYKIDTAKIASEKPLEISSGFTTGNTENFTAINHHFSDITEDIDVSPPEKISSSSNISFSGTVNSNIQKTAYIINSNGFVETEELSTSSSTGTYYDTEIINDGGSFSLNYNPSSSGAYIVEIVDQYGLPVLNHPVYIGSAIPLIPDFFDLNQRDLYSGSLNLDDKQEEMLDLINESRNNHGLSSIVLSDELSDLALGHSKDMADNNFFSHINEDNETPEDRRNNAGILTGVSENIAKDVSIEFAHEGLMRSATHRDNILDPEWQRVGIGIDKEDGYLYITQEFSTFEISEANLDDYKDELFTEINNARDDNGLSALEETSSIELAANYINDAVINDGESLTTEIFEESLNEYNILGQSNAISRTYNLWSGIMESIIEEDDTILESKWERIGIDIQLDETGNIHTMFIVNNP